MGKPPPGQRKRRWAAKTRTGCMTCRIRRIKCDEQRPLCARCIKDGFTCDGYSTASPGPEKRRAPETTARSILPASSQSLRFLFPKDQRASSAEVTSVSPADELPECAQIQFLLEPSGPYSALADYDYGNYFIHRVSPLLSTTRAWRNFWKTLVPQISYCYPAIRHAMIALAVSYETQLSQPYRLKLVLQRHSLAIRAFVSETSSIDLTLVFCRLFSAVAQCNGDWSGATMHMNYGGQIVRQSAQTDKSPPSQITRLLARPFLAASADRTDDAVAKSRFSPEDTQTLLQLEHIRHDYIQHLTHWLRHSWCTAGQILRAHLVTARGILNDAFHSVLYPTIIYFNADDPITPPDEIVANLHRMNLVITISELVEAFTALSEDIDAVLSSSDPAARLLQDLDSLISRLKHCTENYILHSYRLEPRMTAGTFWIYWPGAFCTLERHLNVAHPPHPPHPPAPAAAITADENVPPSSPSSPPSKAAVGFERRQYFLDSICSYRSGLMPGGAGAGETVCVACLRMLMLSMRTKTVIDMSLVT